MEREPSEPSKPHKSAGEQGEFDLFEAAQAAERVVETPEVSPAEPRQWTQAERTRVEQMHDAASDFVETRRGQGVDETRAWAEVDASGTIQRDFQRLEEVAQDELNHTEAEAIRKKTHDANVADIEKIEDPVKREQAMRELLAKERAQNERRGRRW